MRVSATLRRDGLGVLAVGSNKSHIVPAAVYKRKEMVGTGRFELLRALAGVYSRVSAMLRRDDIGVLAVGS
ncbi:MAG: hypothetical protein ACJ71W_15275 [Terriglobales bacterium]